MRAFCLIRSQPVYRREAFEAGLKAAGYQVQQCPPREGRPGDVLVIWNRYGEAEQLADRFEAKGGTVIVAENGYLDPGRHTERSWYALAIGGHNGQGEWHPGGGERWAAMAPRLGAELTPWRERGEHILVCPNRVFGRRGYVMPGDFAERVKHELGRLTKRPVRIRAHPGNEAAKVPLEQDLKDCWAVVIWASSAGVKALLEGIPVVCLAPAWICKGSAHGALEAVQTPGQQLDRMAGLERLAWAQWHVEEIARGEPFRHLLPTARQGEVAPHL